MIPYKRYFVTLNKSVINYLPRFSYHLLYNNRLFFGENTETYSLPVNVWICVVWEIKIDNVGNKLKVDASGNPGLLIFVPLAALLVLVNFLGLARFDVIPQFWVSFFQKLFVWGHDDLVEAAIELTDNVAPVNKIVFVIFGVRVSNFGK